MNLNVRLVNRAQALAGSRSGHVTRLVKRGLGAK